MGSDENHFNVSFIVREKVTRQCPQTTTFEGRGAEAESNRGPSAYQPNALLLAKPNGLTWSLVECRFTSTETVGLLGTGAQDGHLDFHTAPEL